MATRNTLGVGFLGAGLVSQAIHLPTLARLPELFHVAHVTDIAADVAQETARRVGARWSTSVEDLLADPGVDVVAICGPHRVHAEHTIAAFGSGVKAVLCEKPLTTSLPDAERIARAAQATGVPLLVGAMHRYDPGWTAVAGSLPEQVHTIRSTIVLPPNARYEDFATEVSGRTPPRRPAERDAAALVSSGVLGLAIHDLPLIRELAPNAETVSVAAAEALSPFGYHIVLALGARTVELFGTMTDTWTPQWTLEAVGREQALDIEFTPSYVHAGSARARLTSGEWSRTFGPVAGNGYEGEWRHIADVVRGAAAPVDVDTLVADLRFAVRIAEGAAELIRAQAVREEPRDRQGRGVDRAGRPRAGVQRGTVGQMSVAYHAGDDLAGLRHVMASLPLSFRPVSREHASAVAITGDGDWPDVAASAIGDGAAGVLVLRPAAAEVGGLADLARTTGAVVVLDSPWSANPAVPDAAAAIAAERDQALRLRSTVTVPPGTALEQAMLDHLLLLTALAGPLTQLAVSRWEPHGYVLRAIADDLVTDLSAVVTPALPSGARTRLITRHGGVALDVPGGEAAWPARLTVTTTAGTRETPNYYETGHRHSWRRLHQALTSATPTGDLAAFAAAVALLTEGRPRTDLDPRGDQGFVGGGSLRLQRDRRRRADDPSRMS